MKIKSLKGYVVDVDGTLYSQKKLRLIMLLDLLSYYVVRPARLKELYALYVFRKLREQKKYKSASFEVLYHVIHEKTNLPEEMIGKIITHWMFKAPLKRLKSCAYSDMVSFLNKQHDKGKKVIIWSDYPAVDKLEVLGIIFDDIYAFGVNGIDEQKPSRSVMEKIIFEAKCRSEELLYIGDRNDRDRASAKMVNMPYRDIKKFRKLICGRKE